LKTRGLIIILIVLIIILCSLVYLYLLFSRPPKISKANIKGISHIRSIYGFGSSPNEMLLHPHGVALDKDNNIYVTDQLHFRVVVFDKNGNYLRQFGKKGKEKGHFDAPMGIDVGEDGKIYVCDRIKMTLMIFNNEGRIIKEIRAPYPLNVEVEGDKIFLTTAGSIGVFDRKKEQLIQFWGQKGREVGEFDFPQGLDVDREGNVYVSDSNNTRIIKLDKKGEVVWIAGRPPRGTLDPDRPIGLPFGLVLDEKNHLFVVDSFHYEIKAYDTEGKYLTRLGSGESGQLEGEFYQATDIDYMGNDTYVIADKYNNRLQILRLKIGEVLPSESEKSFASRLYSLLKPWCPYIILIFILAVVGIFSVFYRRRKKDKEEITDTRMDFDD
jgi:tripartite motif-containing protein 71